MLDSTASISEHCGSHSLPNVTTRQRNSKPCPLVLKTHNTYTHPSPLKHQHRTPTLQSPHIFDSHTLTQTHAHQPASPPACRVSLYVAETCRVNHQAGRGNQ